MKCKKCKTKEAMGWPFCSQVGSVYCEDCHEKRWWPRKVYDVFVNRTVAF